MNRVAVAAGGILVALVGSIRGAETATAAWQACLAPGGEVVGRPDAGTVRQLGPTWAGWVTGQADADDYRVDLDVTLDRVLNRAAWQVGVLVRYQSPGRYYRVQMSDRGNQIALWKPTGSVVATAAAAIEPGKTYHLRCVAQGAAIRVELDGRVVIDYHDPTLPIPSGRPGVAVCGAEATVANWRVTPLPRPAPTARTTHRPVFTFRKWMGAEWLFDGQEPIARFYRKRLSLYDVKLRPGYRPLTQWYLYWRVQTHGDATELEEMTVEQQGGPEFVMRLRSITKPKTYRSHQVWRVTYDAPNHVYRYTADARREPLVAKWAKAHHNINEFFDPYYADAPAAAHTGCPGIKPCPYDWVVLRGPDGVVYKRPLTRDFWAHPGTKRTIAPGGFCGVFPGTHLAPVTEFLDPGQTDRIQHQDLCLWAYDTHFRGSHDQVTWCMTAYPTPKARRILSQARLHPSVAMTDPTILKDMKRRHRVRKLPWRMEYLVHPGGRDRFALVRRRDQPVHEQAWIGWYEIERTVGHGDRMCLRLRNDGTHTAYAAVASTPPCGTAHRTFGVFTIRVWVRTRDVRGKPELALALDHRAKHTYRFPIAVRPTQDWTPVVFRAYLPWVGMGHITLSYAGPGTVWVDDLEILPPEPGRYIYEAEHVRWAGGWEVVDDPQAGGGQAGGGQAIVAQPGKHKPGYMLAGPYTRGQPVGPYKATFRLKVAGPLTPVRPVGLLEVQEVDGHGIVWKKRFTTADFAKPDTYQEFTAPFRRTVHGCMQYRFRWRGQVRCTFDRYTITLATLGT